MKKYEIGMYGGKFMPFHKGHNYCIEVAAKECKKVYVILFAGGNVVAISKGQADSALDTNSGYTYNGGDVLAISMAGGMGSESANTTSSNKTIKSSLSISSGSYVTVTINGATKVVVKSPISISAQIVYLGSNTASITTSSNASATLDSNGVYWNV